MRAERTSEGGSRAALRMNPVMIRELSLVLGGIIFISLLTPALTSSAADERLRVIIETDAGGDPDDEQSLVRFLLYTNEWDVEGIIANRELAIDGENLNSERTGLGIVRRLVDAYSESYPNLRKHDPRYPKPEVLLARTVSGVNDDGMNLVLAAVDKRDRRPIWFCNWGTIGGAAPSSLKRALDKVLTERGPEGYARFKNRIRLSSDDQFGEHTTSTAPPWKLWIDTFRPEIERRRWYHRFSAITAKAGGFDIQRDVRTGHGPLGALYPLNTTHAQKEGDSMTFLYLIPTGMNDPEQPDWGSWAGRYAVREPQTPTHYWATAQDTWNGTTHRENTLARWAEDLQSDFRARMDWCVKPYAEANHPPKAMLNGEKGMDIVRLRAIPGSTAKLSARASSDPDRHPLAYHWSVYPEAGTYAGAVALSESAAETTSLRIPPDSAGKTIHVILAVRDSGSPPLAAYRRAIIQVGRQP